ncbi:MAG: hypothetical protein ACLTS6_04245 [Anaerobutyricum sp.]
MKSHDLKGQLATGNTKSFEAKAAFPLLGKAMYSSIEDTMEAAEVRKCTDSILNTCGGIAALFAY